MAGMRVWTPQDGNTALIVAAGNGHLEAVALLLDHDADLEAKDNVRASALATERWRSPSLSDGATLQSSDRALGLCWSQEGKAAVDWLKAEHLKALVPQILENTRRARERERAAKQAELEEAQARCAEALAAKQAEMEEALAAKQAEMDAQADAAQAYRTATVATMAALEARVKQLEDLAQLL